MQKLSLILLLLSITAVSTAQSKAILKKQALDQNKPYHYFENPKVCSGCHWDKFKHWTRSQHARAFTGDFFQKQFYDLVLASESFAPEVKNVKEGCIGCHSPSAFLAGDLVPPKAKILDNYWMEHQDNRFMADRGVSCDFCHTIDGFKNDPPYNHDYISNATEAVDTKLGDLEFPWSPHHETATSDIYEAPVICASCHNELNPYNVWVKATYTEYEESVYPSKGISCQICHMTPMGGKPAKMGPIRPHNTEHWWGGGFTEFVEGAARVEIKTGEENWTEGETVNFSVDVQAVATGHKFPTGSTEERDVWLRLSLVNSNGEELLHIPVPQNPDDPNDKYFITSNEKVAYPSHSELSEPIVRDALPEGDRLYHSAFLDNKGKFTYAQWFCAEEIENRLNPLEIRNEKYAFIVPEVRYQKVYLQAKLFYRRMPDSFADYLKIKRRPVILVASDIREFKFK